MIVNILLGVHRITIPKVAGPGFGCLEYYLVFIYNNFIKNIKCYTEQFWKNVGSNPSNLKYIYLNDCFYIPLTNYRAIVQVIVCILVFFRILQFDQGSMSQFYHFYIKVSAYYFFDDILQHCKRQAVLLLQKTSKEMTSLFLLLFSTVLEMACRFRKYLGQLYLFCQGLLVYKVLQQQITWMAVIFIPFVQANISAKVWEKIKSVQYYLHFTQLV